VRHWWEVLLHNQSALRLKARLLFQPGVMMVSVPWQLSAAAVGQQPRAPAEQASVSTHEPESPEHSDAALG